jgi:type I restriction enzyme S subunit
VTVTLELLFPHLDDLIQTPADVQRLNEAILQLAVQGKLVPQDPQDEPAGALLKRIAVEKAQLLGEDKIRKSKPIPSIELNETPYELPKGWEWVRLGEIVTLWNGRAYSREELLDAGTPIIRIQNLNDGDQWYYSDLNLSPEKYCDTGDLLYAWSGTFGPYIWQGGKSIYHYHIWRVDLYCQLNKLFVFHFLKHISESVRGDAHGVMLLHMTKQGMEQLPFPLPPLAEQKRIVAKVDELFAQTRALEAKLRRAQEAIVVVNRAVLHHLHHAADNATFQLATQILGDHFDLLYTDPRPVTDLRQTILQLAVQGKLVPQDPHDEPAGALLKRIAAEGNQKRLSMVDDEQPYMLPTSWQWVNFGAICDHRLGKMLDKQKNKGEYRPYLRNLNVQWDRIDFEDVQVMRFEPQEFDEYRLRPGDLLICEGGEPGRCAIWEKTDMEMMFQKAIHRARPCGGINPRYLLFHLKADAGNGRLAEYFTGATIKHFTGKALFGYLVALPPLAEQKRIVAKVDELLARCAALERKLGQAQVAGRQLTAAVLQGVVG